MGRCAGIQNGMEQNLDQPDGLKTGPNRRNALSDDYGTGSAAAAESEIKNEKEVLRIEMSNRKRIVRRFMDT